MNKELFKTEEDIKGAVASFTSLKQTAGWQLIVEMLDRDIQSLTEQILDGEAPEEKIKEMRKALKIYKEVVNTPDYWIKRLNTPETEIEKPDPYYTVETLAESRRD